MTTDFAAIIESAQDKRTFSVLDAVKGRAYPQDIVTVYTDVDSAYEIHRIEQQIADLGEDQADSINTLDEYAQTLREQIRSTSLTFRLRGIGRNMIDSINAEGRLKFPWTDKSQPDPVDFGDGGRWVNASFLAAHIVDVTDAEGNVDDHKWSAVEVTDLRGWLPDESFMQLLQLMQELSFAATYFDASVTPDFS